MGSVCSYLLAYGEMYCLYTYFVFVHYNHAVSTLFEPAELNCNLQCIAFAIDKQYPVNYANLLVINNHSRMHMDAARFCSTFELFKCICVSWPIIYFLTVSRIISIVTIVPICWFLSDTETFHVIFVFLS